MVRLQKYYRETVVPKLKADLKIDNPMQIPKITKITINMGVGEAVADKKVMDAAVADLTKISGQKPLITKSRKAIASFKIREGLAIGCKVTLRGARMYEFLDRLISIAMPRIRDFRGVPARSFDGQGNYSMGVKEQIIFPEIQYDQIDQIREDKHGRARKTSRQDRETICGKACAAQRADSQPEHITRRAREGADQAAEAASGCQCFAAAESLCHHGPLTRRLS
jgi:large subunit ribosomal protein L5